MIHVAIVIAALVFPLLINDREKFSSDGVYYLSNSLLFAMIFIMGEAIATMVASLK